MHPETIFRIDLALGYLAAGLFAVNYLWPKLTGMERGKAIKMLATIHSFRYFGLSFLLIGVVGAQFPRAFAEPTAYGDLLTSLIAIAALFVPTSRGAFWALAWTFNVVGALDLVMATVNAIKFHVPELAGQLGADYAIPMIYVPMLVASHVAGFALLLQGARAPSLRESPTDSPIPNL